MLLKNLLYAVSVALLSLIWTILTVIRPIRFDKEIRDQHRLFGKA